MNNKKGLSREELLSVMAVMDGELHGDLKHVAQSAVQPGPRQEAALATHAIGEFVRGWAKDTSAHFDVAESVMAKVAMERPAGMPAAHAAPVPRQAAVIPFPAGRAVTPPAATATGSRSRVFAIGAAVTSLFAAAAAAMVFIAQNPTTLQVDSPASMAKELPNVDVQVQQVESPNTISVFQVPASLNANGTSVVIWIDDAVGGSP